VKVFFAGGGTGGHLYPGIAIARALVRADARVEPFFIGARRGIEREILPTTEFPYELLDLHPLYRSAPWNNWRTLYGGFSAWRRVAALARDHHPAALVATGGYAAGVALGYASRRGIPIIIQEQNSFAGMTVRWFARYAAQIHMGFPEAAQSLKAGPHTQLYDSGNPIEPPPASRPDRAQAAEQWGFDNPSRTIVLVFGGSQGARGINQVVAQWVRRGGVNDAGVQLIWATGKGPYAEYRDLESPLVKIRPFIAPMQGAYAAADLAVCRAGAMATAELAAWGVPAILIPLPTAAADHQTANARALALSGAAVMIAQSELSDASLSQAIQNLADNAPARRAMRAAALRRARPDAADRIAAHILSMKTLK
jgi:UDP-N-acetylglucosamine--N-acetylmuramyl-(pentapeptide) pyrophosphoryl-undecaprenol N-acetylglucosamine transferase